MAPGLGELLKRTENLIPCISDAAPNILLYPNELPGTVCYRYDAFGESEVVNHYWSGGATIDCYTGDRAHLN